MLILINLKPLKIVKHHIQTEQRGVALFNLVQETEREKKIWKSIAASGGSRFKLRQRDQAIKTRKSHTD